MCLVGGVGMIFVNFGVDGEGFIVDSYFLFVVMVGVVGGSIILVYIIFIFVFIVKFFFSGIKLGVIFVFVMVFFFL